MAQKVFILLLTIGILGGLVFYLYTISLEFEDSVFTPLDNAGSIPPSVFAPPPPTTPPPPPTAGIPAQPPPPAATPTPLPTPPPAPLPPAPVGRATLSLVPSSVNLKVGEEFKIDILIDTADQNVVAALASISFDGNILVGERIDVLDSVFPVEAEKALYAGSARIVRGARSPGFNGSNGLFASIYFRAKAKGSGTITIELEKPGSGPSRIILDDGAGTDILKSVINARYTIL